MITFLTLDFGRLSMSLFLFYKRKFLHLDYCVSCEEETIYRGADLEMNEETIYRGADLEVEEETIYRGADLEMNQETIYRGADLDRDEEEHDMDNNFPERNGDISGKLNS